MEEISDRELLRRAKLQAHEDRHLFSQLKKLRIEKEENLGLTQRVVADRMGTAQPNVSRLENGQSNITMRTLREYLLSIGAGIKYTVVDYDNPYAESKPNSWQDHHFFDSDAYFKADF